MPEVMCTPRGEWHRVSGVVVLSASGYDPSCASLGTQHGRSSCGTLQEFEAMGKALNGEGWEASQEFRLMDR